MAVEIPAAFWRISRSWSPEQIVDDSEGMAFLKTGNKNLVMAPGHDGAEEAAGESWEFLADALVSVYNEWGIGDDVQGCRKILQFSANVACVS